MSETIWKYQIKPIDQQAIKMPVGAQILHVAEQHGQMCLWALIDPSRPEVERGIAIVGTGFPAPSPTSGLKYIGTAVMYDGSLVFHAFDAGESA